MLEGKVYKSTGSWYLVKSKNKFFECRIKGKIRLKDISTTNPIINIINGKEKQVIISKSNFKDYSLTNYILDDDVILELNKYGIPEPKNGKKIKNNLIDVVFVPLLSYDKKGSRVGYGKGFYDRFLSNQKNNIIKVGLSFFGPEETVEKKEFDQSLDYCITPEKVFSF